MGRIFLSTLSLRRATLNEQDVKRKLLISIHALLAESDLNEQDVKRKLLISIHALLAESDTNIVPWLGLTIRFLSTLSLRRATCNGQSVGRKSQNFYPRSPCGERLPYAKKFGFCDLISIHALLAESDLTGPRRHYSHFDFYPRSPCGERRLKRAIEISSFKFLSTLSLRRATLCVFWQK